MAPFLNKEGNKFIKKVCGKSLFLGRAVENTLMCPVSAIISQSADAISHVKAQKRGAHGTSISAADFEIPNTLQLKGNTLREVYTKVYDIRETVFSDQTGKFPTLSQRGNKNLMVMVEINSNVFLVEPLKSRKDPELT